MPLPFTAAAAFYGNADRAYNTPHNKQALCHPPRVHSACLLSVACHLIQTSCGRYLFPRGIGRMMYLYRYLADDAKDAMYQGRMVHTDLN